MVQWAHSWIFCASLIQLWYLLLSDVAFLSICSVMPLKNWTIVNDLCIFWHFSGFFFFLHITHAYNLPLLPNKYLCHHKFTDDVFKVKLKVHFPLYWPFLWSHCCRCVAVCVEGRPNVLCVTLRLACCCDWHRSPLRGFYCRGYSDNTSHWMSDGRFYVNQWVFTMEKRCTFISLFINWENHFIPTQDTVPVSNMQQLNRRE